MPMKLEVVILFQTFVVLFLEPTKKTLKTVNKLSMESSFCIWLAARDNAAWQSVELNTPFTKTHPPESRSPSTPKAKIKSSLPNSLTRSKSPVGFINKGNTCYAILQALSAIPLLWRTSSVESAQLSPLLKSITLNIVIKEKSLVPIDPSNFLLAPKRNISSTRSAPFDFNSQQDVAEILQVVFDELKRTSVRADDLLSNTLSTTIICNSCLCSVPTHNPSSVWILSLLTQFSGSTTLQSLVSGKALQEGLTKLGLVLEE